MASLMGGHVTGFETSIGPAVSGSVRGTFGLVRLRKGDWPHRGLFLPPSFDAHLLEPRLFIQGESPRKRLLIGGHDLLSSPMVQAMIIQYSPDPLKLCEQLGPVWGEGVWVEGVQCFVSFELQAARQFRGCPPHDGRIPEGIGTSRIKYCQLTSLATMVRKGKSRSQGAARFPHQ